MNQRNTYFSLLFLCFAMLLSIGGICYLGNGLLQKQTKTLLEKKIDVAALEEEQKSLAQAKKDIEKYKNINEISKAIVPQDKDQAKTVRDILSNAAKSQTPVQNIVFNSSTLGTKAAATATGSAGSTSAAKTATPAITQVKPVDGIPGVYSMEITLSNTKETATNFNSIINFLKNLENSRRTAHIANISLTPDKQNPGILTYTITLKVYIKPEVKK